MPAFRLGRIPKRLKGNNVVLELLTFRKWTSYYRLLREADEKCLENLGFDASSSHIRIFLWSLFLFSWAYVVTFQGKPVGIVGIYGFEPRLRLFLTLAVFKDSLRRKGIGRETLDVLASFCKQAGICSQMLVEVRKENTGAICFWRKIGFRLVKKTRSTWILRRRL